MHQQNRSLHFASLREAPVRMTANAIAHPTMVDQEWTIDCVC
jgi:hypothetical protein